MNKNIKSLKKSMKENKRGQLDILFFIIIVAGLAIFILIVQYVVGEVSEGLLNSPLNTSSEAVAALNYGINLTHSFDYIWLTIFVGLILGVLISSVLIDVHPIFIPIWILLMAISIIVGVVMNNVYAEFVANETFNATSDLNPFANAIISNYILVIIGVAILSMILIFAKVNSSRSQRL